VNTGFYISLAMHGALVALALFGGFTSNQPLPPPDVAEVDVLTEEEFAALLRPFAAPSVTDAPPTPELPPLEGKAPDAPERGNAPDVPDRPEDTPTAAPDDAPAPLLPLAAEAEVADRVPAAPSPPQADHGPEDPVDAQPSPAPRVAAIAAPPPPPTAELAPDVSERSTPALLNPEQPPTDAPAQPSADPGSETPGATQVLRPAPRVQPAAEAPSAPASEDAPDMAEVDAPTPLAPVETASQAPELAPPEATTRIVTEAARPTTAPTRSLRPSARPTRAALSSPTPTDAAPAAPQPPAAPEPQPEPAPQGEDEITTPETVASGPPLTGGERDAFRVSVQTCWNLGSLSTEAMATTVTLGMTMSPDGKPESGSINLISSSSGNSTATRQAYEAARRAILRCGTRGYDLPADKYDRWRQVEITFNPSDMRTR